MSNLTAGAGTSVKKAGLTRFPFLSFAFGASGPLSRSFPFRSATNLSPAALRAATCAALGAFLTGSAFAAGFDFDFDGVLTVALAFDFTVKSQPLKPRTLNMSFRHKLFTPLLRHPQRDPVRCL